MFILSKSTEIHYIFLSKYLYLYSLNKIKFSFLQITMIYNYLNFMIQRQIWLIFYLILLLCFGIKHIKLDPFNKNKQKSLFCLSIKLKHKTAFTFINQLVYIYLPLLNSISAWRFNMKSLFRNNVLTLQFFHFPSLQELELFYEEEDLMSFLSGLKLYIIFLGKGLNNKSENITFLRILHLPVLLV